MGGFTKIQLEHCDQENIDLQNEKLDKLKLHKGIRFYSEKDIEMEYDFYLNDEKREEYFPPHLFPYDEIKSYEDFRKIWTGMGEAIVPPIGSLTFDCYFDRTSKSAMYKIAQYLYNNMGQISEVSGSFSTFIERSGISQKRKYALHELEDSLRSKDEPEKLPEEDQYIPKIQTGHFLCKSFSIDPFWIAFGSVDEPTFLKKKIYVNDAYNELHKDENGYAFMLMPQMPLGIGMEWFEKVINKALDLGLREHPLFILSLLYGATSNNEENYIKELKEWYTADEMIDRFKRIYRELDASYGYRTTIGFQWDEDEERFRPVSRGSALKKLHAHCQILTALKKASGCENWKENF